MKIRTTGPVVFVTALLSGCASAQQGPACAAPIATGPIPAASPVAANVPRNRIQPRPLNVIEMQQALIDAYPPDLREAGVGGTVGVWTMIDATGDVVDVRLQQSSGFVQMDQAALRVAREFRFEPATEDGCAVPVWVAFPISFSGRG